MSPGWIWLLNLLVIETPIYVIGQQQPGFQNGVSVGNVNMAAVIEVVGIAASRNHAGILYAHNRHEPNPKIYALNASNAEVVAILSISGAHQHGWEDITVGACTGGGGSCIYVADTGLGRGKPANIIYRIREPATVTNQSLTVDSTLKFSWNVPECQTLMVDPTGQLYIVSTVLGGGGKIARLPATSWGQQNAATITSMTTVAISTRHHDPRGGDISPNGEDVILKTVNHVYYWHVLNGDYLNTLTRKPTTLPIHKDFQNEEGAAVCWNSKGDAYYTLDEGSHEPLYVYRKAATAGLVG